MKKSFVCIPGLLLLMVLLAFQPRPTVGTEVHARKAVVTANDSVRATQTVLTFLNWYKKNIHATSRIPLVNQQVGKPYSVNLKNGEQYLAYLRSSNLLTDRYLNEWRTFFRERNEGFQISPQTEGPPSGFEYDLVMLTQDVDLRLNSLNKLTVDKVTIRKERSTVQFTLEDTYEFRLVHQHNRWMINEILNLSQE